MFYDIFAGACTEIKISRKWPMCLGFSLKFLSIFVDISGSTEQITLIQVSLKERSSPPAELDYRWCRFWSKVMTSEVKQRSMLMMASYGWHRSQWINSHDIKCYATLVVYCGISHLSYVFFSYTHTHLRCDISLYTTQKHCITSIYTLLQSYGKPWILIYLPGKQHEILMTEHLHLWDVEYDCCFQTPAFPKALLQNLAVVK